MDMVNIFGQMEALIKVILSMELDMDMAFGRIKVKVNYILDVIEWIKNKVSEYTNGLGNKHIKDNFVKIIERVMVDYTK
jgi:hypothetical protein